MNLTGHIDQEDLSLFAMKLLSEEESLAIAQHLDACQDCRRELAAIQADLALFASTVDIHTPPSLARERLLKQVAKEKKVIPISTGERSDSDSFAGHPDTFTRQSGTLFGAAETPTFGSRSYTEEEPQPRSLPARVIPWIGWGVAACLALGTATLYHQRESLRSTINAQSLRMAQLSAEANSARQIMDTITDHDAMRVTLNPSLTKPVPQGHADYIPSRGALVFIASNMAPLQPNKTYELWLIPADGHEPIPAGTFRPDEHGSASVIMPPLPKGVEAKAFGVTIENDGGSQVPTLPIIMVGA